MVKSQSTLLRHARALRRVRHVAAAGLFALATTSASHAAIVINELDSDTPGTDMAEFVELYDGGVGNTALDGLVLVFFNGSTDTSYAAFDLDGFMTNAGGFFLLGNAAVPGVGLTFSNNLLQNGADAVALYTGNGTDFPNGTAATGTNLLDSVVYDTSDSDDAGLLAVFHNPQINEDAGGNGATSSVGRAPDFSGEFITLATPTPGALNIATNIVINEVDSDTPGADTAEFIELYDGGAGNTSLAGMVLVLYNGSNDQSYAAFDLDGFSTDANGFFVLGNAAVPGVDLVFADGLLMNGADAVALYGGNDFDFPNGTAVTAQNLLDSVVYDTNDADDAGLLAVLRNPQINESALGDSATDSVGRSPDHSGAFTTLDIVTPGALNVPLIVPMPAALPAGLALMGALSMRRRPV
ncbi:MAG: hypothetical protein GC162_12055 [Planctomycetes bacterium]|nr:hypothetical protein [Planctomycetota bacterium]